MAHTTNTADTASSVTPSILAVVVLYKTLPERSSTVRTLLEAAQAAPDVACRLRVLLIDNTPGGQDVGPLQEAIQYKAVPHNPGLAAAYNDALQLAIHEGFDWLLTLDQDTSLPASFLIDMAAAARLYEGSTDVGAIVPRMVDQGKTISPFRFVGGWFPRVLSETVSGVSARHTSALNSGSLFNTRILHSVGGYDERFPLHNSDTRVYQRLDIAGKRVAIAGHVVVPHELSILDRQNRITPDRYRLMLEDECDFWDHHMSLAGRLERLIRLAGRACKGLLQKEKRSFQEITVGEMWRRISTTRRRRTQARDAKAAGDTVIS
jgi:GT2 family glycosyltransferase